MAIRLRDPVRTAPAADDDRALLARFAKTGDQSAFATIVARHGSLVLGVCRRILRDPHRADDAFQAVFLVLARKAGAVGSGPSVANWLFGVARRVALTARRDDRRWQRRQERAGNPGIAAPVAIPDPAPPAAEWGDLLGDLDDELARLPDSLRAAVLECYIREKTQDEAARTLGWSVSTLRRRLDRAKDLLRTRLTARGATFGAALIAGAVAASAAASVPPVLAQAAVAVATAGRAGGPVPASLITLARGAVTMSVRTKRGLGALAAGIAAVGLGVGLGTGAPAQPRDPPPAAVVAPVESPTAVAVQVAVPAEDPPPVVVKPTAPAKSAGAPRPVEPPKPPTPPPLPGGSVQPPPAGGEWVTITGRVKLSNPPEKRKIEVATDKEHCLSNGNLFYEDLIVNPKNGGVKYAVVWLRPDTENRKDPFPKDKIHPGLLKAGPRHHVIDQPCCQFVPRVLAARGGDTLEFKNSAPVPHNINYGSDDEPFNVTIPPGKSHKLSKPLTAQSTPVPFKCDIHPWMAGRLRVFDHPYFAVTDDDGTFEIKDAPAGKWRLVIWQENGFHKGRAGLLGEPVEVKGSNTLELKPVELELPKP